MLETSVLKQGKASQEEAIALFDCLDPVDLEWMFGCWKGAEFSTRHPMDGFLEPLGWYGKEFVNPECVHPLLFSSGKNDTFKVAADPQVLSLVIRLLPILKNTNKRILEMLRWTLFTQKTESSQARLRMVEYRGKLSATMIYDRLPICDVFRKVDDRTVLGWMDLKEWPPFFFTLTKDMV